MGSYIKKNLYFYVKIGFLGNYNMKLCMELIFSRCKYLFINNSNNFFIYLKNYNYIYL